MHLTAILHNIIFGHVKPLFHNPTGKHMKRLLFTSVFICIFILSHAGISHSDETKDHMKAFLMSLFVPGLGQYYAGSTGYAKIFIASELAIWGGYFYNTTIKEASRQDYYSQAALHAGVNPEKFGASYLNAVGAYNSSYEYNMRRLQSTFNPVLYTGIQSWNWDREENRLRFRNLRERELEYENNVKFCIAGIVLNHFLAALNASKLVQSNNRALTSLTVNVLDNGLAATYRRSF